MMLKVLNVGGNSKSIPLPSQYVNFEHLLLDIDPTGEPDILCDARDLASLQSGQLDMIYCSHNLEHYYRHDVRRVLDGFFHVLKPGGGIHIVVPDVMSVMKTVVDKNLDIDDVLYQSALGPILVSDVLYGYGKQIEESGVEFFAHKTGFSHNSLAGAVLRAGFGHIHSGHGRYEVTVIAFKGDPSKDLAAIFDVT